MQDDQTPRDEQAPQAEQSPSAEQATSAEQAAPDEPTTSAEPSAHDERTAQDDQSAVFAGLPLAEHVQLALDDLGHTEPTPIQSGLIPALAAGRDVIGQAQTGTGKTGAFALPILSRLDPELKNPQALVLVPTRELAIQVAGAVKQYAGRMQGFKVLAIFGGTDYTPQFRALNRGVHVVVGTPGRLMDHLRRGSLVLDDLTTIVLDEADEMLRMGFIDDVEWILEQTPPERQSALFSATMPGPIRRIARRHLRDPAEVTIAAATTTVAATRQRYVLVDEARKPEALARVLEGEATDGVLVFVRTRVQTTEVADQLAARGFKAAALSGELPQAVRARTVERLRRGSLDVLVATDVAARGLDIDRLSHVVNYDVPNDAEAYVHRIGRTGRAGREGDAVLFVTPAQRRLLRTIEHATKQRIERMAPPAADDINAQRIARFAARITRARKTTDQLGLYADIVDRYCAEHDVPELEVAAALAQMAQGDEPLLVDDLPDVAWGAERESSRRDGPRRDGRSGGRDDGRPRRPGRSDGPEAGLARYRVAVGRAHGVKAGNLVGAIANEAGVQGRAIGRIDLHEDFSLVDLPAELPDHVLRRLQKVCVFGLPLLMERADDTVDEAQPRRNGRGRPGDRPRGHHDGFRGRRGR